MPSVRIPVRVQPRARADEIVGVRDGVLVLRVRAPPLDGRANDAACAIVARQLGIRPAAVEVVGGERSRDKLIEVRGADAVAVDTLLREGRS